MDSDDGRRESTGGSSLVVADPHRRRGSQMDGLLVDYGGVLTTSLFASFADFCTQEGLEPETLARSLRHDRRCRELLIALETGRLAEEEFEARLADILGVADQDLIVRISAGSRPDAAMVSVVRAAREAGVRTGLVSNSWGTTRYDRVLLADLFDAVVISGEIGIRKPAPQIYLLAAERIGIPPHGCVFVDDLAFNLKPAADLGMATVHHVSSERTATELERLLGMHRLADRASRATTSNEAGVRGGDRQPDVL